MLFHTAQPLWSAKAQAPCGHNLRADSFVGKDAMSLVCRLCSLSLRILPWVLLYLRFSCVASIIFKFCWQRCNEFGLQALQSVTLNTAVVPPRPSVQLHRQSQCSPFAKRSQMSHTVLGKSSHLTLSGNEALGQ